MGATRPTARSYPHGGTCVASCRDHYTDCPPCRRGAPLPCHLKTGLLHSDLTEYYTIKIAVIGSAAITKHKPVLLNKLFSP